MIIEPCQRDLVSTLLLAMSCEKAINRAERHKVCQLILEQEGDFAKLRSILSRVNRKAWDRAEDEIKQANDLGIAVLSILDSRYPHQLRSIPDPPAVLFIRGNVFWETKVRSAESAYSINDYQSFVAIVGMREASYEGRAFARSLAKELTIRGGCVVSGLAIGIDRAAHHGALDGANKRKGEEGNPLKAGIEVLGSGVNRIYPERNEEVAEEIIKNGGAIISEYGLRTEPRPYFFPERNRIVSGLSAGVVVVEAQERSGALVTARLALEQGREVFAVPGAVSNDRARGTIKLIKEGAHVVSSADDIIEVLLLGHWYKQSSDKALKDRSDKVQDNPFVKCENGRVDWIESEIRRVLSEKPHLALDELVDQLGVIPSEIMPILSNMEIRGELYRFPGNLFSFQRIIDN